MLKHIITGLSVIAIITAASNQTVSFTAPYNYSEVTYTAAYNEDITYELKYLYDKTGKKFAAEICLKNNTDKNFRVTWTLKGSLNINLPADSGTKDIPAFTKVCIMTVFPIDPEKVWDPGVFHFDWEVIE